MPNNEGINVGGTPLYVWEWVLESRDCTWMSSGGGTNPGSGTSNSPGSGGSGSGSPNGTNDGNLNDGHGGMTSAPAIEQETEKKCTDLNRLSTSAYLQTQFGDLASQDKLTKKYETGYGIVAKQSFPYVIPYLLKRRGDDELATPTNEFAFALMHNHYIGKYEMFGHGDIHSLYRMSQTFNASLINTVEDDNIEYDLSSITVFMVVRNKTYAIKIDDISKLAQIDMIFATKIGKNEFESNLNIEYEKVHNDPEQAGQPELIVKFLKFVTQTYDFGISLYVMENNAFNTNTSFWKKLTLNETDEIVPTNCN